MPYFIATTDIDSIDNDWERDLAILEEEMFLNEYFDKHGVFTIENY